MCLFENNWKFSTNVHFFPLVIEARAKFHKRFTEMHEVNESVRQTIESPMAAWNITETRNTSDLIHNSAIFLFFSVSLDLFS